MRLSRVFHFDGHSPLILIIGLIGTCLGLAGEIKTGSFRVYKESRSVVEAYSFRTAMNIIHCTGFCLRDGQCSGVNYEAGIRKCHLLSNSHGEALEDDSAWTYAGITKYDY